MGKFTPIICSIVLLFCAPLGVQAQLYAQHDQKRICPQYGYALDTYANTLQDQIDRLKIGIMQTEVPGEAKELTALLLEKAAQLVSVNRLQKNFKKAWDARKPNSYFNSKEYKDYKPGDPTIYTSDSFSTAEVVDEAEDLVALQKTLLSVPKEKTFSSVAKRTAFNAAFGAFQGAVVNYIKKLSKKVVPLVKRAVGKSGKSLGNVLVESSESVVIKASTSYATKRSALFLEEAFAGAESNLLKIGLRRIAGGGFNPLGIVLTTLAPLFMGGVSGTYERQFTDRVDDRETLHPYGENSSCKSKGSEHPEIIFSMGQSYAPGWLYCCAFEGNPDGFFAIDSHTEYKKRAEVFARIRDQYMNENEIKFRMRLNEISTKYRALEPRKACLIPQPLNKDQLKELFKKYQQPTDQIDFSKITLDPNYNRATSTAVPTFWNPSNCKDPVPNLYDWAKRPTDMTLHYRSRQPGEP